MHRAVLAHSAAMGCTTGKKLKIYMRNGYTALNIVLFILYLTSSRTYTRVNLVILRPLIQLLIT